MCDFTLTKRNDLGKAYANIYLLSSAGQQIVPTGTAIKFNGFSKLASISLSNNFLVLLKDGTFKIDFIVNYVTKNNTNAQVALFINGQNAGGAFGSSTIFSNGVRQLVGSYTMQLVINDTLQLKCIGPTFTIKNGGVKNEIIANFIVSEI